MIELDLHVEASLDKEDILYLAKKQNVVLPDDWYEHYLLKNDHYDYFTQMNPIINLMQRREALEYIGYAIVKRTNRLGVNYAEFVFTPSLFTRGELDQKTALNHFLKGFYRGLNETPFFKATIVLGILKAAIINQAKTTYELAKSYKNDSLISGLCLYGDSKYNIKNFDEFFALAKEEKIPFSIEVCDDNKLDELTYAINLGATRLNVHASFKLSYELMLFLQQHQTILVFSPSYLIAKGIVDSPNNLPMLYLASRGVRCTISSGYNGILETNLINEYRIIKNQPLFKKDLINDFTINAIDATFTNLENKKLLIKERISSFEWFYKKLTDE